jgi:hypothetical protein
MYENTIIKDFKIGNSATSKRILNPEMNMRKQIPKDVNPNRS